MMAEKDTAVIKAAKTFLQMFNTQCFLVTYLYWNSRSIRICPTVSVRILVLLEI